MDELHLGLAGNAATSQGALAPGIGPTPPTVFHLLSGVALDSDQLAVFAAAALAAAGLWYLLRRTRIGLEIRAVVDRDSLASLRGVNPARASAIGWVLSTVLAGLGGILIAPLFNLDSDTFTLVVLGSLAAVLLGGLRSLPIAFVGGLLLGVVQDLVAGYNYVLPNSLAHLSGLRSAVPYLLVLVLGLIVGRDRTRRAGSVAENHVRPDHRRGMSALRRRLPWVIFTVLLIGFSMQWAHVSWLEANAYDQTVIAQSVATAIILLSFVVVTGIGGMVSLAQATFATAGGFAAGWALSRNWGINIPLIASHGHLNFAWASLGGALVGAVLGVIIAIPATRLGAVYLALWSLAAAFFFSLVVFGFQSIGQGQLGWTIPPPTLSVPGLNWVHHLVTGESGHFNFGNVPDQILLFLGLFGLVTALIHFLLRSASGRAILAVRSSQVAAQATGIRANRTKIAFFALSAGIAGLGGVMLSLYSLSASNSTAPPEIGLIWLAAAVLFGIRRPGGALLAGLALGAGPAVLHWVASGFANGGRVDTLITSPYFLEILFGFGAIGLAQEPDGILTLAGQQRLTKRRRRQSKDIAAIPSSSSASSDVRAVSADLNPASEPNADTPALVLSNIVAGYEGVEVLHGVSLTLHSGQIVALLGANGAGKSTFCSVASGILPATSGTVVLRGSDVSSSAPYERSNAGLQLVPEARGVFPGLSVAENLELLLRTPELRDRAYERFPMLAGRRGSLAGLLSGGEQQLLSLAPAIVDPPAVLITDEPTLGLAPLAAAAVMDAILELRDEGTAVLLVEEHAQNALRVANTLAVMSLGRITWTGPTEEADVERLSAAYLGENA